jgi:hypothetical protein
MSLFKVIISPSLSIPRIVLLSRGMTISLTSVLLLGALCRNPCSVTSYRSKVNSFVKVKAKINATHAKAHITTHTILKESTYTFTKASLKVC